MLQRFLLQLPFRWQMAKRESSKTTMSKRMMAINSLLFSVQALAALYFFHASYSAAGGIPQLTRWSKRRERSWKPCHLSLRLPKDLLSTESMARESLLTCFCSQALLASAMEPLATMIGDSVLSPLLDQAMQGLR